ncbi:MAG: N-6 DNA methylase, partial [Candidatus Obscuribacterales bacterium]|nr:N-6 DNA methylase [Candidatus Obscuribacterales bacterium]
LFKKSGGSRLDCSKSTFLDPACGAGHLMIPALNRLIGAASLGQNDCRNRLVKVLKEQLFGFDLDPHMVRLTGFSLYLHCRDLAGVTPLPIPQIYSFDAPADFNFGSLSLGVDPDQQAHRLVDPRGAKKSARDLPLRFDFIAANPPYLSHRLMPKALGAYLKKFYPGCHFDLYAAFLELSMRLLNNNGCASLICQQSFLSINRYESLRRRILKDCSLKTVIQLGPGSFAARGGEKVNNAIITFRKHCQKQSSPVRTLKLLATKEKERARESGIDNLRFESIESERIKKLAESIPGYPISCFCPDEIARLFDKYQALESKDSGVVLTNGLFTCNNRLFVKRFFEIEKQDESIYVPYDKGGGRKWFANTPYRLAWQNDGEEIRAYRKSRGQSESLPGESYYFKQGLTYSYIGTRGFTARLLAPGSVFDIASSALFTSRIDLNYLLGWLNSKLIRFVLGVLNPT